MTTAPLNCTYTLTTDDDGARVAHLDGDLEVTLTAGPYPARPFTEDEVAILDDGLTRTITAVVEQLGYTVTSGPLTPGPVTLDRLITVTIDRKDLPE